MSRPALPRRLVRRPEVRYGQVCLRSCGITAGAVLARLFAGEPAAEIVGDYPGMSPKDVTCVEQWVLRMVYAQRARPARRGKGGAR